jgi:hypothetical protein
LNVVLELTYKLLFFLERFCFILNKEWGCLPIGLKNSQEIILVENHDIIDKENYDLGINIYSELVVDDFLLTHHPTERSDFFLISADTFGILELN